MKKTVSLIIKLSLLLTPFSLYASEYLCEPKKAAGVVANKEDWQIAEFNVGKSKYKISGSGDGIGYNVEDISKTKCQSDSEGRESCTTPIVAKCHEGFSKETTLDCELAIVDNGAFKKTGINIFSFDKRSMRFMHYPMIYSGFLYGPENSHPFFEVGQCFKL